MNGFNLSLLTALPKGVQPVAEFNDGRKLILDKQKASFQLNLGNEQVFIFGEVFYFADADLEKVKFIGRQDSAVLAGIFAAHPLEDVIARLEGQYVGVMVNAATATVTLFSDRYARKDMFYAYQDGDFFAGQDIELIASEVKTTIDPFMVAHMFGVYGWYTPKGTTLYKNIKQLKVGEVLTLSSSGLASKIMAFKPVTIGNGTPEDHERYYQALKDAVVARAQSTGKDKIWISSSSGWDSSMILGLCVDAFGPSRVGMMAGSMSYSPATGTINKFEMDKIAKIAGFYGIKPNVVEFDWTSTQAPTYWASKLAFLRSRHMYTMSSYNFAKISDGIAAVGGEGCAVFNGETSDSFHNFGFSQFGTFFHTEKSFTEYADKMNCYLYSPSFYKKIIGGKHESDKVFQIFKKMYGLNVQEQFTSIRDMKERYLYPLFYGGPRVPFAKTYANPALTVSAQDQMLRYPFGEYMPEAIDALSPETLYAWMIYLYHSFHSQGSTVGIHKHAMDMNKHTCLSPFNDARVIKVLSQAPESWGRGLDFNHTKHPLKWVAKNKIKFPYEVLQEGPHSYLYDVIEGFSLFAEIMYRSGAVSLFKEALATRKYRQWCDPSFFDLAYLDRIAQDYLEGKEAKGMDFNNLVSLVTISLVGTY